MAANPLFSARMPWLILLFVTITLGAAPVPAPRFSLLQAERLKKETQTAIVQGRTNVALVKADELVALDPTVPEFRFFKATLLERYGQFDKAVKEGEEYLRLKKDTGAQQYLGTLYFKNSEFLKSVDAFNEVIKGRPDRRAEHWQLGISLYYAGKFAEGRDLFELHQTVNSGDLENAAWHFLCTAAAESPAKAKEKLIKIGPDGRIPMMKLYDFYQGKATASEVLAATEVGEPTRKERRDRLFYAHLYLGLYYDAVGDLKKALEHIDLAANEYRPDFNYMGDVARVHYPHLKKRVEKTAASEKPSAQPAL